MSLIDLDMMTHVESYAEQKSIIVMSQFDFVTDKVCIIFKKSNLCTKASVPYGSFLYYKEEIENLLYRLVDEADLLFKECMC